MVLGFQISLNSDFLLLKGFLMVLMPSFFWWRRRSLTLCSPFCWCCRTIIFYTNSFSGSFELSRAEKVAFDTDAAGSENFICEILLQSSWQGFQYKILKPHPLRFDPLPTGFSAGPIFSSFCMPFYGRTLALQGQWRPRCRQVTQCSHRCRFASTRTSSLSSTPPPLPSSSPWSTRLSSSLHAVVGDAMHLFFVVVRR